jgi:hypothetical protein
MIKAVMKSALTAACVTAIASLPAVRAQDAGVTKVITNGPQVRPCPPRYQLPNNAVKA